MLCSTSRSCRCMSNATQEHLCLARLLQTLSHETVTLYAASLVTVAWDVKAVQEQTSHLPNTWHWWLTSTVAMPWPIPEDTPVTTTTRSMFTMTPRLSRGPSSYCERSHPDSSHCSCSSADAPAPGPAQHPSAWYSPG